MTNEMRAIYADYCDLDVKIKELAALKDAKKKAIEQYHAERGLDEICEDGFRSLLSPGTRKTAQVNLIESKFQITIPAECYKISNYKSLRAERLITD